jgi:DNA-binding transcriptional ArsR family regulator
MELYQKKEKITTWLYFYLNGAGAEFLDYKLPFPNFLQHINKGYYIGWKINDFPGTKEARDYFNDVIARFLITFKDYKPEKLEFNPKKDEYTHFNLKNSYELSDFQNLKSIKTPVKIQKRAESINTTDQIFWAIKYYTEDLIMEFGAGNIIPYNLIEEYAFRHFYDKKDRSTLKAKCRNIWNWYNNRDWTISKPFTITKETPQNNKIIKEKLMTRQERAKKNAELKFNRARASILGIIKDNILAPTYLKKDNSWNVSHIAKDLKMSRTTIIKHLKLLKEEGLI